MRVLGAECWVLGRACVALAVVLTATAPQRLTAQQQPRPPAPATTPIQRAFDLERRGSFGAAAEAYRGILRGDPAEPTALLGLERTLTATSQLATMVPELRAGLAARPSTILYGLALRVWSAAGEDDSLRVAAERWAEIEADPMVPYREWGDLLLQKRDFQGARRAYTLGRTRSGNPAALAAELAQVALFLADHPAAAREWVRAQALSPGYRVAAVNALIQTPERVRPEVLRALEPDRGGVGAYLAAVLLVHWGDPLRGAEYLRLAIQDTSLSRSGVELVTPFVDQVRALGTRDARMALGRSLELLAERQRGDAAVRTRLEAARAFADGNDPVAARRMLALVAEDRTSSGALAIQAARTLLDVQIAAGELDEAERTFDAQGERLSGEDRSVLRRRLARAWMRQGSLDRAARLITSDSTVDGFALAGHLALLRGDVAGARTHFQSAGPYAGTREEATIRTTLLALLQPLEADTVPALGTAFLALERGDTAAAIVALDQAVRGLEPEKGSAQLGLLAAQLSWGSGATADAERRFRRVAATEVAAAAPAAELDLARLLIQLRRPAEAITQLEHLILTYPRSALVPQARRLLDEARTALSTT
jgi:tetratricopeptide (TPR) repeat protein